LLLVHWYNSFTFCPHVVWMWSLAKGHLEYDYFKCSLITRPVFIAWLTGLISKVKNYIYVHPKQAFIRIIFISCSRQWPVPQ
jgi:hypothetical protein